MVSVLSLQVKEGSRKSFGGAAAFCGDFSCLRRLEEAVGLASVCAQYLLRPGNIVWWRWGWISLWVVG